MQSLESRNPIIFTNTSDDSEQTAVRVKSLHRYGSFSALFEDFPVEQCGFAPHTTADEASNEMRRFYTEEKGHACGILGIRMELIDREYALEHQKEISEAAFDRYFPDGIK